MSNLGKKKSCHNSHISYGRKYIFGLRKLDNGQRFGSLAVWLDGRMDRSIDRSIYRLIAERGEWVDGWIEE